MAKRALKRLNGEDVFGNMISVSEKETSNGQGRRNRKDTAGTGSSSQHSKYSNRRNSRKNSETIAPPKKIENLTFMVTNIDVSTLMYLQL